MISAGLFYKHIRNFIFTNGSQVDAPTQSGRIEITQPQNGETAEIYGLELNPDQKLAGACSALRRLRVRGQRDGAAQRGLDRPALSERRRNPVSSTRRTCSTTHRSPTRNMAIEAKLSYNYRGKFIEISARQRGRQMGAAQPQPRFRTRGIISPAVSRSTSMSGTSSTAGNITPPRATIPPIMKDYMEPGRTFVWCAAAIFSGSIAPW